MKGDKFSEEMLLSYEDICAATQGNSDALATVLKHFEHYISAKATRTFCDVYGQSYFNVDQELKQRIESKLIIQVVQKFKPE